MTAYINKKNVCIVVNEVHFLGSLCVFPDHTQRGSHSFGASKNKYRHANKAYVCSG